MKEEQLTVFPNEDQAENGQKTDNKEVPLSDIEDPEERHLERLRRNVTSIVNKEVN